MQRQSVRTVAFLGCVTILIAFWWLAGRDLGLHAVDSAEGFVWPWLELLGVAAVWHVLSGRLDLGSGPGGTGLSVTVRGGAVVGGVLAAAVFVNAEYGWWFDVRGQDTGGGDIQVTWESVLKAGAIRFVLVYFAIAAIAFGLAAAVRLRTETEASTRPWRRDALLYLAVVFFCGQLAVVYAIRDADNPLTAPPHWLSLVFMVLALGLALLGGIGRPQAVTALGIDIAVIAVPALALTSSEGDTFAPGVSALIVLAVAVIGIALCRAPRDRTRGAEPRDGARIDSFG
jgi:hypothetical protein